MVMESFMIRDLPHEERPRERLLNDGAPFLSNAELLAILLRTGTRNQSAVRLAQAILQKTEGLKLLNEITIEELIKIKGVGQNKAIEILACIELGKRISKSRQIKADAILSPSDCVSFLSADMKHLTQEHFVVLFLDTKNYIVGKKTIFIGSLNKAIVHPREVFRAAIKRSSASIICAHNHPSGDPTPSEQDIQLTHRLVEAGELIGIKVLDHVIIGDEQFVSLKEKGYI
ncbi:MAG: RadC family protein [Turicibacter sp.]